MRTGTLASAYLVACRQSLLADPERQLPVGQPVVARPSAHLAPIPLPADSAHQTAPLLLQEAAAEAALEVELEAEVLSQQHVVGDVV